MGSAAVPPLRRHRSRTRPPRSSASATLRPDVPLVRRRAPRTARRKEQRHAGERRSRRSRVASLVRASSRTQLPDRRHFRVVDNRLFDLIAERLRGHDHRASKTRVERRRDDDRIRADADGMPRILGVNHHPEIIDREHIMTVLEEKRAHGEVSESWYRERVDTMRDLFASTRARKPPDLGVLAPRAASAITSARSSPNAAKSRPRKNHGSALSWFVQRADHAGALRVVRARAVVAPRLHVRVPPRRVAAVSAGRLQTLDHRRGESDRRATLAIRRASSR